MSLGRIGILHPGKMGIEIAATAKNTGCEVLWAGQGRSAATRARAERVGLIDGGSVEDLARACAVIVSVCPPEFAEQVAADTAAAGFTGTYVDANAISPHRTRAVAERMEAAGIRYVDGGIIGLPPKKRGDTWLHLSGPSADTIPPYFAGGPVETIVDGPEVGQASTLKMCYAAYTKGVRALLLGILGTANEMGILDDLVRQWERGGPDVNWIRHECTSAAHKAWRFSAEMIEIASTFETAGMPGGFHRAASDIYGRLSEFKNNEEAQLDEILAALTQHAPVQDR